VESRLTFLKVRKKQQIDRELDGYLEWMQKAGGSEHNSFVLKCLKSDE